MRRLLLVLALVVALLVTGCVQITNPQFDARYRYHAEPLEPTSYAVFALSPPGGGVRLLIVDVAKRGVVASMPISDVRVLSDLGSGASGGDASALAATDGGFVDIDVAKRTVRPVTTSILTSGSVSAGVGYDRGVRLLWSERPWAVDFTRRPSNEQTASLDWSLFLKLRFGSLLGKPADVGPMWYAGSTSTTDAYFVSRSRLTSPHITEAVVWKADFLMHAVSLAGTPAPWPAGLEPTREMHVERAIRRWGVPSADASGQVRFLSPVDFSQRAVLPAVATRPFAPTVAPRVLFEPGGDHYFTVEPGEPMRGGLTPYATRIVERSLAQPAYAREMPVPEGQLYPAAGIRPLGVIGDTYAYVRTVSAHRGGATGHMVLVLRDLKTGAESQAAKLLGSPTDLDYLGSYTR